MTTEWVDDLLKEKGLWETFDASRRFPVSKLTRRIRRFGYPVILLFVFVLSWKYFDASTLNRGIDAASASLISVSATIIGFLVTGLAIFCTLNDKKTLTILAQTPQRATNVSSFKYLYFNILNIFVVFIFLLVISVVIQVFSKMAIAPQAIEFGDLEFPTAVLVNGLVLAALGVGFIEAVYSLKTFIWNIYATFVSVLAVSTLIEEAVSPED